MIRLYLIGMLNIVALTYSMVIILNWDKNRGDLVLILAIIWLTLLNKAFKIK